MGISLQLQEHMTNTPNVRFLVSVSCISCCCVLNLVILIFSGLDLCPEEELKTGLDNGNSLQFFFSLEWISVHCQVPVLQASSLACSSHSSLQNALLSCHITIQVLVGFGIEAL